MDLPPDKRQCASCLAIVDADALSCMRCGVELTSLASAEEGAFVVQGARSRKVAGVLAILLGGVGVHKFYLGQTTNAVLYLVFCVTLIPALLGVIDGIRILVMTDARFHERFG